MGIVDLLEMVDVDEGQGQHLSGLYRLLQHQFATAHQLAAVQGAGQLIHGGQALLVGQQAFEIDHHQRHRQQQGATDGNQVDQGYPEVAHLGRFEQFRMAQRDEEATDVAGAEDEQGADTDAATEGPAWITLGQGARESLEEFPQHQAEHHLQPADSQVGALGERGFGRQQCRKGGGIDHDEQARPPGRAALVEAAQAAPGHDPGRKHKRIAQQQAQRTWCASQAGIDDHGGADTQCRQHPGQRPQAGEALRGRADEQARHDHATAKLNDGQRQAGGEWIHPDKPVHGTGEDCRTGEYPVRPAG